MSSEMRATTKRFLLRSHLLGSCLRELGYSVLGVPQDPLTPDRAKLFAAGRSFEADTIALLRRDGYVVHQASERQQSAFKQLIPGFVVRGTPDGQIHGRDLGPTPLPLEVKSAHPGSFATMTTFTTLPRRYQYQIGSYLWLKDAQSAVAVIRNKVKQVYRLFTVGIESVESLVMAMKHRAMLMEPFLRRGEAPPPDYVPGSVDCRWCRYRVRCVAEHGGIPETFEFTNRVTIPADSDDAELIRRARRHVSDGQALVEVGREGVEAGVRQLDVLLWKHRAKYLTIGGSYERLTHDEGEGR